MSLQKSSYRKQEQDGWCGPAALQMLLLNEQINLTQEQIAKETFNPEWGTPHENLYAFAKKYFTGVNVYSNIALSNLKKKIDSGMLVLVNIVTDEKDMDSGHYINVSNVNMENKTMSVFDPDGQVGGILEINIDTFLKQWFDYANPHDLKNNIKTKHWALVINPRTKKTPIPTF